jgi:hypothetical protein
VFAIRAVLNTSLTIEARIGQPRQIFEPKFTIPHGQAGITVSRAAFGENNCRSGVCVMSAEIIQFAEFRARRQMGEGPQQVSAEAFIPEAPPRFHFWTGASGKRYVHTVYSLFDCPTLEDANYILVRRSDRATRSVLAIGRLSNHNPSQNLAEIRQHAAELGADEVHVHLLASSSQEAEAVEADLITAQFLMEPHSA